MNGYRFREGVAVVSHVRWTGRVVKTWGRRCPAYHLTAMSRRLGARDVLVLRWSLRQAIVSGLLRCPDHLTDWHVCLLSFYFRRLFSLVRGSLTTYVLFPLVWIAFRTPCRS